MQVADRVGREATFPWGWLWRLKSPAADNVQLHEKRSDESRSETQYEHYSDVEQHVRHVLHCWGVCRAHYYGRREFLHTQPVISRSMGRGLQRNMGATW
jgi:hypothetical protein